ncbi:MAG: J domain-containing protein [Bacilli bacterium]
MSPFKGKNNYEILGVSEDASETDVRRAYNRRIRQYSNETFPEEFKIIRKAYDAVRQPLERERRQQIDWAEKNQIAFRQVEAFLKVQKYRFALEALQRMQNLNTEEEKEWHSVLKVKCFVGLEQNEDALKVLEEMEWSDRHADFVGRMRVSLYLDTGQLKQAELAARALLRRDDKQALAYGFLVHIYHKLGQTEEALFYIQTAARKAVFTTADAQPLLMWLILCRDQQATGESYAHLYITLIELPFDSSERAALLQHLMNLSEETRTTADFGWYMALVRRLNVPESTLVNRWLSEKDAHIRAEEQRRQARQREAEHREWVRRVSNQRQQTNPPVRKPEPITQHKFPQLRLPMRWPMSTRDTQFLLRFVAAGAVLGVFSTLPFLYTLAPFALLFIMRNKRLAILFMALIYILMPIILYLWSF